MADKNLQKQRLLAPVDEDDDDRKKADSIIFGINNKEANTDLIMVNKNDDRPDFAEKEDSVTYDSVMFGFFFFFFFLLLFFCFYSFA